MVRSKKRFDMDNLPKKLRTTLKDLKEKVKCKIIDIRKVDKGNLILIIDFEQRVKIGEMNIQKLPSVVALNRLIGKKIECLLIRK